VFFIKGPLSNKKEDLKVKRMQKTMHIDYLLGVKHQSRLTIAYQFEE